MSHDEERVREVVGLFDQFDYLQSAIDDLEISGFDRRHVSVLGSREAMEDRFGKSNVPSEFLEDHPDAPRAPMVSQEELGIGQGAVVGTGVISGVVAAIIASGGLLIPSAAVTTIALGGAGGAAVSAALAKLLGDKYRNHYQEQIDNGGLLLWIHTPTRDDELKAQSILEKHHASDIHVHEVQ